MNARILLPILFIIYRFHPFHYFSGFLGLIDFNLGHRIVFSGPVPMLYACRADNYIAWSDLLNRLSPFLGTSQPGSDDQSLAYRMNMPMGLGTGLKGYADSARTH